MTYISSACGRGKTKWLSEEIKRNKQTKYLVVQPTKELLEQFHKDLGEGVVLHSDNSTDLLRDIGRALYIERVVLITDKMFWKIPISMLKDCQIYLDDCTSFFSMGSEMIKYEDREILRQIFDQLFEAGKDIGGGYCEATVNFTNFSDILKKACLDYFGKYKFYHKIAINKNYYDSLYIVGYYDLSQYVNLNITFMANNFENSMLYKYCTNMGICITKHKNTTIKSGNNNKRLTVRYFNNVSKDNRGLSKKMFKDKDIRLVKIKDYISKNVECDFIWTSSDRTFFELNGNFLTPCQRGINSYRNYNVAVWMCAMNLNPQLKNMMSVLFSLGEDDFKQECEYEAMNQFVYRTSLRDYSSTSDVTLYVYDSEQAKYFSGANVEYIDIGLDKQQTKKNGRPRSNLPEKLRTSITNFKGRMKVKYCTGQEIMDAFVKWWRKILNKNKDWSRYETIVREKIFDIK